MALIVYRRRAARLVARTVLTTTLLSLPAAMAAACTGTNADSLPDTELFVDRVLARPQIESRIVEWGRDVDSVRHDLLHLTDDERQQLGCLLHDMLASPSDERDALFVTLVAVMREQRLFRNVIRFSTR